MRAEEVKSAREGWHIAEMNGEDITPKQDGGVLKLIKKEGSGMDLPMTGDKVYVHYTSTLLDGAEFESSRDREFCFELGKGEVIKAWDLGVATMKAGEVSRFICKPEYAYGRSGSPPKVPPSTTLVFEWECVVTNRKNGSIYYAFAGVILLTRMVELLKFHGEDVTKDEDGGVIRRIVTRGGGHCKPTEGTTVQVTVEGMFGSGVAFDRRELSFVIGYGESLGLPIGVETAIMSMDEGEESLFTFTPKYGFGKAGNAEFRVPPGAALQYRIKLLEFEKARESWQMNVVEKLEESNAAKEKAAQFFKEGKYRLAVVQYKRILGWLARESDQLDQSEPHSKEVRTMRLVAHLNLAMCYLKMQEPAQAAENCNTALELDDGNEKALFRRAQACFAMEEFERALDDFQRLLQLYPGNRAAKAQMVLCQKRLKEQREKDKRLYASLFRKCSERNIKEEGLKDGKQQEEEEGSCATGMENGGRDQKAA